MKNSVLSKFLSSGVQALAVQILGIFFFYFISIYCSKESFGVISWANAVSMFLTTVLSFGMEQVVTRRIAVSKTSDWAAAAYLFHSLCGSAIVFTILLIWRFVSPESGYNYLPYFFIAQGLIYISTPLRQYLNAKERFAPYAVIAIISNLGKILSAYWVAHIGGLTLKFIALIMIGFSLFELLALGGYVLLTPSFQFSLKFRFAAYKKLIREALPQYIAVIFDSSLSRMDWILLGILSTSVMTADYSFAYRGFEIAKLPLAIVAPVILPRFARMMGKHTKFDDVKKRVIEDIFIVEMFLSVSLVLILNILWTPLVVAVTNGKYGLTNKWQFLLLSICIPLQFFTNLLWTISFTGKKYKTVTLVTIASAICNLVLNLILIPLWSGMGAAVAFLITCIIQTGIYFVFVRREYISFPIIRLLLFYVFAAGAYYMATVLVVNVVVEIIFSLLIYSILCFLFKQIGKSQVNSIWALFSK